MMAWIVVNVVASVTVAAIVTYKLAWLHDRFTRVEMAGMGMLGAGFVLSIAPIIQRGLNDGKTPFDDWVTTLIRFGVATYFIGRMMRRWKGGVDHEPQA